MNRSLYLKAAIAALTLLPTFAIAWTPSNNPVTSDTEFRNALNDVQSGQEIILGAGLVFDPTTSDSAQTIGDRTATGTNNSTDSNKNNYGVSCGGWQRSLAPQFKLINKSNITIRSESSTNRAKIKGTGYADGKYGFYAQKANGLVFKDIEISNAEKGLIIDRSDSVVVDNVYIHNIGHEALHFRDGSDSGIVRNSLITLIGMDRANRGEGLYICNDKKKWHTNYCAANDDFFQENCDNFEVYGNTFGPNIGAEHIDIKEGTRGHNIHDNTFIAKIDSGTILNQSYPTPKSLIHDKGYNNRIHNNDFNLANMVWEDTSGEFGAIRLEQVLESVGNASNPFDYRSDLYGHNGGYVYNVLTNSNNGTNTEYVAYSPSYGGNSAKVGCDTINGSNNKYRVFSGSKSGLDIDGNNGNTGASVVSGSACNTYAPAGSSGGSGGSGGSTSSTSSTSTTGSTSGSTTSSSSGGDFDSANWNNNAAAPGQSKKSVNISYSSGQLNAAITATDPYIRWDETANVDGHDQVKVKVLNNAGGGLTDFKVFFQKGSSWYSKDFTVPNDNTWKWKTVDMSSISAWSGNISKLRVDGPQNATSGNFKLDFVKLIANTGGSTTSSTSSTSGSTSSGGGGCLTYAFNSGLKELTLPSTSGGCVDITGGSLTGSEVAIADSDANTSCDLRGTATGSGGGSWTIDGNWEVPTGLSGSTLTITPNNGCKYFKLRVR